MSDQVALIAEQILNEELSASEGVDRYYQRYRKAVLDSKGADLSTFAPEAYLVRKILNPLAAKIEELIFTPSKGDPRYQFVRKILKKVHPDDLAFITLRAAFNARSEYSLKGSGMGGCKVKIKSLTSACRELGTQVEDQINFQYFKETMGKPYMDAIIEDLKSSAMVHKQRVFKNMQ
jgi:hypothetical protein